MCIDRDSNIHTDNTHTSHMLIVLVTAGVGNGTSMFRDVGKGNSKGDRGHSCRPPKPTHNPNDMKTEMQSILPSSTSPTMPDSQPSLLPSTHKAFSLFIFFFLPLQTAAAGFTTTWPNLSFSVI